MNDLPVILSYFAQSPDEKHLEMLEEEKNAIQLAWENATEQKDNPVAVRYVARSGNLSTPKQILDDIEKYGERIVLFHFSGHADQDELLLSDSAGGPAGIAGSLGLKAPNLKVVVLNGCSTGGQVNTFFQRGIRVVVATQCAVKDTHAKLFGITFHQMLAKHTSIQQAYRDAILAVKAYHDLSLLLPETVSESAIAFRSGMLDTSPQTTKVWGLFTQNDGAAVINDTDWLTIKSQTSQPQRPSEKPQFLINPEKAYICERNRANYVDVFNSYFDPYRNPNRPRVQHYLLAGARTESPLGLIRKLFYQSIMQAITRQFYYYSFKDLLSETKVVELSRSHVTAEHVLSQLLLAVAGPPPFSLNSSIRSVDDLCTEFFAQNSFKQREYVVIAFRMQAEDLTDTNIKAIGDAVNYLNQWAAKLPPGRLSFLFFWTALQEKPSFWNTWLSGSPIKKLISRFETVRTDSWQWYVLNQDYKFLNVPDQEDIENWLNDHYRPMTKNNPDVQTLYAQTNVETLENQLLDLINEVNEKAI
ncbi:CHAT domain-containing protein [Spirosoma sp. KNUC1025]|uniref:CHAT domain-containing protein n=1 Tax=Spirosoma sp. KNUC1025 TaxID=2894082 RepID=UPI003869EBDE|nr:CHAT domain-containing protein [Spirosoma sp. KNUC1025]